MSFNPESETYCRGIKHWNENNTHWTTLFIKYITTQRNKHITYRTWSFWWKQYIHHLLLGNILPIKSNSSIKVTTCLNANCPWQPGKPQTSTRHSPWCQFSKTELLWRFLNITVLNMLKRKEIPQQAFEKEKQERKQGKDSRQKSKNHKLMKTLRPLWRRWT